MIKKEAFDVRHPWFKPVWTRILVTGLTIAWATVEFMNGNNIWAIVFGAAGAYLVWAFFVDWQDPEPDLKDETTSEGDET